MHDLDLHGVARIHQPNPPSKIIRNNIITTISRFAKDEQKIIGILAVYPEGANVSFSAKNRFKVDWGDGSTQTFSSGLIASRTYVFEDLVDVPLNPLGFKEVTITITPQNRYNLTEFNMDPDPENSIKSSWLSIDISTPNLNSFILSTGSIKNKHPLLKYYTVNN